MKSDHSDMRYTRRHRRDCKSRHRMRRIHNQRDPPLVGKGHSICRIQKEPPELHCRAGRHWDRHYPSTSNFLHGSWLGRKHRPFEHYVYVEACELYPVARPSFLHSLVRFGSSSTWLAYTCSSETVRVELTGCANVKVWVLALTRRADG